MRKDLRELKREGVTAAKIKIKKGQIDRKRIQIKKKEDQIEAKKDTKHIALTTSRTNYIDPRILFAFIEKYDVPVSAVYTKTLREKFQWAGDMLASMDREWDYVDEPLHEDVKHLVPVEFKKPARPKPRTKPRPKPSKPRPKPRPSKPRPKPPIKKYIPSKKETIIVKDYSSRSGALFGDFGDKYSEFRQTFLVPNENYSYNPNLKFGPGWFFSTKHHDALKRALDEKDIEYREVSSKEYMVEGEVVEVVEEIPKYIKDKTRTELRVLIGMGGDLGYYDKPTLEKMYYDMIKGPSPAIGAIPAVLPLGLGKLPLFIIKSTANEIKDVIKFYNVDPIKYKSKVLKNLAYQLFLEDKAAGLHLEYEIDKIDPLELTLTSLNNLISKREMEYKRISMDARKINRYVSVKTVAKCVTKTAKKLESNIDNVVNIIKEEGMPETTKKSGNVHLEVNAAKGYIMVSGDDVDIFEDELLSLEGKDMGPLGWKIGHRFKQDLDYLFPGVAE